MNGCRPPRPPGAHPRRLGQSKAGRTMIRACSSPPTWAKRGLSAAVSAPSACTRSGEVELGLGGADVGFGEAEFAAYDVGAFDQSDAFVIGDAARQALAAKAAIGRNDEALGRDVFERLADQAGDVFGRLN